MTRAILLSVLWIVPGAALAQDAARGRLLYETHCVGCHAERLHHRSSSSIDSIDKLRTQVERWSAQTGRAFSAAERDDLVEYLASTHYRSRLTPADRAR